MKASARWTLWWTRISFAVTLGLTLILMIAYLAISDRTALGEWITIWPPLLWCFGLIPLAILSLNRHAPKYFAFSCLAIVVFLATTTEWRSLARRDPPRLARFEELRRSESAQPPLALRVITWNIAGGAGGHERLLGLLEPMAADLMLFQESPDQNEHLADPGTFFSDWTWLDDGDCALLSRHPARRLPARRAGPWSAPQLTLIELPGGKRLLVVNVRLMLPSLRLNLFSASARAHQASEHRARMLQFEQLADLIAEARDEHQPDAVILAGDFNTPGRMFSLSPLSHIGLKDCWPGAGVGWGATMTADFPVSRIDQCWTSREIEVLRARVILGAPSDHRALLVDMLVP